MLFTAVLAAIGIALSFGIRRENSDEQLAEEAELAAAEAKAE